MFADSCASCDTRFYLSYDFNGGHSYYSVLNEYALNCKVFKLNWKRFELKWESVKPKLIIILVNSRGFKMKSMNYIGSILSIWNNKNLLFSTVNVDFEWVNTVTSQVGFQIVAWRDLIKRAQVENFLRCSMAVIMLKDSKDRVKLMKLLLIQTLMVIQSMSELKCSSHQEHKSI